MVQAFDTRFDGYCQHTATLAVPVTIVGGQGEVDDSPPESSLYLSLFEIVADSGRAMVASARC